ncbi:cytochrome C biogenesis protein [Nibricoccus aquaticus]|uniref:Cytochrome C biogenesis protein n=1 Tax=Nibricoccus aquaticus TaxID=2576891 RepID=A0A290Q9F4_9BACT|nr:cytochrome c biogenesis protein CcsA [Nibricoccus aquaticus]ATC62866.1 cytochrome C biogenesis protein [Nibricoccus aquaticus]
MKKLIPILVLVLGALYLASGFRSPKNPTDFDVTGFGKLPVLLNGRIKPVDTVARTTLLTLQGRQRVNNPERSEPYVSSPTAWLLDVVYRPELADTYTTFKIDNLELLSLIGKTSDVTRINYDSGAKKFMVILGFLPSHHSRFSYADLSPHFDEIERQSQLAASTESPQRTPFQRAVLTLRSNLGIYQQLKYSFVAAETPDFFAEVTAFQENITKSIEAAANREAGKPFDADSLKKAMESISRYEALSDFTYVRPIPSHDPAKPSEWLSIGRALLQSYSRGDVPYEVLTYAALGKSWRENQPERFNEGVRLYRATLEKTSSNFLAKTDTEARFNHAEPFYKSMNLYMLAFFVAIASWLRWPDTLGRVAFWLITLAFISTTIGFLARMWIGGYAPVTNLYSSALFVGWVAGGLCLALEAIYKNAIGSVAAGMIGFGTLLIAHHLSLTGDTLEMMRAVLDSNFWLATHVITVTAGYGATFLAGFLAIIYIFRGLFTRSLDKTTADTLTRMVYGIVCFAMFFSFVGTILGGIWADQSWGRFWGWDPKENGALIIVIWNAIILHARWGGLVKQRGIMALAVFGNIVTGWSWFGTNLLEVGLHSYGFTDNGAKTLAIFVIAQLAIIALALIPLERWRSFATKSA